MRGLLMHVSMQQGCAGAAVAVFTDGSCQTIPPGLPFLCAGIYTFTLKDGTKVPARFSYLFVKRDGKW
jgi:hypothetical protein